MHLPRRRGDDLDALVDQPSFRVAGQISELMPARSGVGLKVCLHALACIRPRQDDAVLAERDAFDLDKRPLEVIPPERGNPLRSATEWTAAAVPELSGKLFPCERSRTNPFHS